MFVVLFEKDLFCFFTDLAFRRKGGLSTCSNSGPEEVMLSGPIRVKQVNQSSAVIGHIDELASTTC